MEWNKPVQRTVYNSPWIAPAELDGSMTVKFMRYRFEPNMVDPDNPLQLGNFLPELRLNEKRSKKNRKLKEAMNLEIGEVRTVLGKNGKSLFIWLR